MNILIQPILTPPPLSKQILFNFAHIAPLHQQRFNALLSPNLLYQIGLTLIPHVGNVLGKYLIGYCGSIEDVFKMPKRRLLEIPGVGEKTAESIINHSDALQRAEEEMVFIQKHHITPLFFFDSAYPQRLKKNNDAPMMLYFKGNAKFNTERVVSIVGTRNASDYGKELCNKLVAKLVEHNTLVVSGLAYGIDHAAHQACVQNQLATVGVLAHGLDRIYPPEHEKLAKSMLENGGLLSEFISNTKPDKTNFPQRNRIIAGISDATIVVETAPKGGSMITALMANSYQRDVFAFPGRTTDKYSTGCNLLIKSNQGILVESADDIAKHLNWKTDPKKPAHVQKQLFVELEPDEEIIIQALQNASSNELHIDQLSHQSKLGPSATATALLMLEFKGLVRALVGNVYKLS